MPDIKISALPAAASANAAMEVPVNDGGVSRRVALDKLRALANTVPASSLVKVATPVLLTNGHYGKIVSVTSVGTGSNVTLPAAPPGTDAIEVLIVRNDTSPAATVNVLPGSGATLPLGYGKEMTFISLEGQWKRRSPQSDGGSAGFALYKPGSFYPTIPTARVADNAGVALEAQAIYFQPFVLPADVKIKDLLAAQGTAAAAGGLGAMAIYNASQTNALPTTVLAAQTGTFAADANGHRRPTLDASISGGRLYCVAVNISTAGARFAVDTTAAAMHLWGNPYPNIGDTNHAGRKTTGAAIPVGTWPDLTGHTFGFVASAILTSFTPAAS